MSQLETSFCRNFWMKILSILFFTLDYWPSDLPSKTIYGVSSRYWNLLWSVTRGSVSSILVSAESSKFLEKDWQNNSLYFSSHQNLDSPIIVEYAITFDLSGHANSFLTATTGFVFHFFLQSRNRWFYVF